MRKWPVIEWWEIAAHGGDSGGGGGGGDDDGEGEDAPGEDTPSVNDVAEAETAETATPDPSVDPTVSDMLGVEPPSPEITEAFNVGVHPVDTLAENAVSNAPTGPSFGTTVAAQLLGLIPGVVARPTVHSLAPQVNFSPLKAGISFAPQPISTALAVGYRAATDLLGLQDPTVTNALSFGLAPETTVTSVDPTTGNPPAGTNPGQPGAADNGGGWNSAVANATGYNGSPSLMAGYDQPLPPSLMAGPQGYANLNNWWEGNAFRIPPVTLLS